MSKVIVFGDSFSMDYNVDTTNWTGDYQKFKKNKIKTYPNYVSEYFGYDCENFAHGGDDNYTIFEKFCNNVESIEENDILIIGWGPITRFRVVDDKNQWMSINGKVNLISISDDCLNEISVNRNHIFYEYEIRNWEKLIRYKLKNVFFYSWFWSKDELITKYESVETETNGLIKDGHWSENGHREFSKTIIEKIKTWKENL